MVFLGVFVFIHICPFSMGQSKISTVAPDGFERTKLVWARRDDGIITEMFSNVVVE